MKMKDALIIALALVLAAGPAEYVRIAVMRWDVMWPAHESNLDDPTGVIHDVPVCPADGAPMRPLRLREGDVIRLRDSNERTT